MRKIILLFLFFTITSHCFSQKVIDSLQKVLKNPTQDDTSRINTLGVLGMAYYKISIYDSSQKCFEKAKTISEKINYRKGILRSSLSIGMVQSDLGHYPEALVNYDQALKLSQLLGEKKEEGNAENNLALVYYRQGNYSEALKTFLEALRIRDAVKDKSGAAATYNNIGNVYVELQNYTEAIKNYNSSLLIKKELGNELGMAACYSNIGRVCHMQEKYDEALKNYNEALKISEKLNSKFGMATCFLNIGSVYIEQKKYKEALTHYESAIILWKEMGNTVEIARAMVAIANVQNELKNYSLAEKSYKESLQLAKTTDNKELIKSIYFEMGNFYYKIHDYKNAFDFQKLLADLKDTMLNETVTQQVADMQTKYETEKKQEQIEKLQHENEIQTLHVKQVEIITTSIIAFCVLAIIIALLFVRQYRLKIQHEKLELERKLLRSQMNPHFIFNSLLAIQRYVFDHPPGETANYIADFATLMRQILESSRENKITLDKEINMIKLYMELQRLRFHNQFNYRIEVDPQIDVEADSIPPLFAQPVLENAIEHGLANKKNGNGFITVRFKRQKNGIEMEVEDNGIGRDKSKEFRTGKHISLATSIMRERINVMGRRQKKKISFEISDLKNEDETSAGTKVLINFPEN